MKASKLYVYTYMIIESESHEELPEMQISGTHLQEFEFSTGRG